MIGTDLTAPVVFNFGQFELVPAMRLFASQGRSIKVGGRALDILVALVERAGQIVAKHELMSKVWRNVVVEETNLRVHISVLRRLLGDNGTDCRYIVHVARRGYIFVAPLVIKRHALPQLDSIGPLSRAATSELPAVSDRSSEKECRQGDRAQNNCAA